jgi:signal transduction histidine kinase
MRALSTRAIDMGPATQQLRMFSSESEVVALRHPDHRVQFYKDDTFLAKSIAAHLGESVRNGGAALLISTPDHRQLVLNELGRLEIPADAVLKNCITVDASDLLNRFMVCGLPDLPKFKAVIRELIQRIDSTGHNEKLIAAYGEMVSLLLCEGNPQAAVQLERFWNQCCRLYSISLLCGYPIFSFSGDGSCELFASICSEHSAVVPVENFISPISQDVQAREVAELQQRAEALETEIQARKKAEDQLRATRDQLETTIEQRTQALRQLSLQVLKLQDVERRRVARELHDSVAQDFVALKVNLGLARNAPDQPEIWDQCEELLEHCIREVRTLSYVLHPPMMEDAGIAHAAEWYIQDFGQRTNIAVSLVSREDIGTLPDNVQLVVFRVLQESLRNVYRHACASTCQVCLSCQNQTITLEVQDNGKGIAADRVVRFNRSGAGMGVGLTGVWERVRDLGGESQLTAGSTGTSLRISIPLV